MTNLAKLTKWQTLLGPFSSPACSFFSQLVPFFLSLFLFSTTFLVYFSMSKINCGFPLCE